MARTNQNASFYAYNTHKLKFCLFDDDQEPPVALNIAGATLNWLMAKMDVDGTPDACPILVKGIGNGITVTDAANGILEVLISPDDTVNLDGNYYHELELIDTGQNRTVQATGTITIQKNVINV